MKKIYNRVIVTIIAMVLLLMPLQSFASEIYLCENKVLITDSKNTGSGNGDNYSVSVTGTSYWSETKNSIVITNKASNEATIGFSYSASSYNTFTIAGTQVASPTGTYTETLAAGGTISIELGAKKDKMIGGSNKVATLNLTNISCLEKTDSTKATVKYDSSLGTVTVDEIAISNGGTIEIGESGVEFSAVAINGGKFYGWVDETGYILSREETYTQYTRGSSMTVEPIFATDTLSGKPYFMVDDGYIFSDLNKATEKGTTIVLLCNGTLAQGTYTIPTGKILLIPFDDVNTLYTNAPTGVSDGYTQPTGYRTLIMSSGANITVKGAISLSAKHFAANGGGINSGSPTGNVSFIEMKDNSSIVVNNGGKLYAWGYIIGSGSVIANSGAEIFEYFQIMDFRGGTQTTSMQNGVFPLSQYYIQNIEVPLTIHSGAKETTYTSVYMRKIFDMEVISSSVPFFGNSGAMFNLTSGYVTKRYDGTTDRLIVELNGDMSIAPMSMDFGLSSINSANYDLPVNSNITINVNSGNVLIKQDLCLLPGAEINVEKGATGTLNQGNSFYIYDADEWGTYCFSNNGDKPFGALGYAPGRTYTRTEADLVDAKIKVNGTLNAEGYAYTTQSGANIYSTDSGIIKMKPGVDSYTYQLVQSAGSNTQIPITTAKLKNADESYFEHDGIHTEFSYSNGAWGPKHDIVSHSAKAATCEEIGWNAYEECSLCDYSTYNEIAALGHNYVNYICTGCKKEKIATNTDYSISDNKITINSELIEEVPPTSLILIAIYDSSDKLLDSKLYYANALDEVTFNSQSVNKIRVFSWEGFSTIKPLSMVEEKLLQQ